jgi:uncharacterized membrane protein YoaK (UPF0700 family)
MTTGTEAPADRSSRDRVLRDPVLRDRLLFLLTLSSGAVDAISFLGLGKVFTAFMTGNIGFLGMAISRNAGAPSAIAVLVSMAGFAAGVYLATRIVAPPDRAAAQHAEGTPRVVWPGAITFCLGLALLPHLGFVTIWLAVSGQPGVEATRALLATWALAMGMQSGAVRRLDVSGVFTTAATATYIFLIGNVAGDRPANLERRRWFGVLASLLIGATAGGLMLSEAPVYAPILPLIITLGVVAAAAIGFRSQSPG